jgi:hypothetical protein
VKLETHLLTWLFIEIAIPENSLSRGNTNNTDLTGVTLGKIALFSPPTQTPKVIVFYMDQKQQGGAL